jgi:hypothetical protein
VGQLLGLRFVELRVAEVGDGVLQNFYEVGDFMPSARNSADESDYFKTYWSSMDLFTSPGYRL